MKINKILKMILMEENLTFMIVFQKSDVLIPSSSNLRECPFLTLFTNLKKTAFKVVFADQMFKILSYFHLFFPLKCIFPRLPLKLSVYRKQNSLCYAPLGSSLKEVLLCARLCTLWPESLPKRRGLLV